MSTPTEDRQLGMGKYRRLAGNIGFFLVTAVSTRLITFIMIPLYTSYLSQREYGLSELALTTVELAYPVLTLMVAEAVLRFGIDDRARADSYITSGFWVTVVSCLLFIGVAPVLRFSAFGGLGEYGWYVVGVYVVSLLQGFFGSVAKIFGQMRLLTIVSVLASVITAGMAVILIAFAGWGIDGYFVSYIVGNGFAVVVFVLAGRYWRHVGLPEFGGAAWSRLRRMVNYSAPLVPNALSWWLLSNVNRYVITVVLGVSAMGLYSAASKIPNFLSLIAGVFYFAWTLSAFQEYQRSDVKTFFATMFSIYQAVLSVGCGALILLAPWLASILLQGEFFPAWTVIPTLLVAFYLNTLAMFFSSVYTTAMKTRAAAVTTVAGAAVTVALSVPLVDSLGLEGAALSVGAGTLTLLVYRVWDTRRILNFGVSVPVLVATCVLLTGVAALTTLQFPWHYAWAAGLFVGVTALQGWAVVPIAKLVVTKLRSANPALDTGHENEGGTLV